MITELNHIGLFVRDLKKSLDFYQRVLGARIVYEGFIPSSKTDVRYLQIGGGMIELLAPRELLADTNYCIDHIAFLTDDLEVDHRRIVEHGYEELVAPKAAGSGVGRLSFVRDPNGARVELIERDLKMRQPKEDHPIVEDFDHFSLVARNLEGAIEFYRDLIGLKELCTLEVPPNKLTMVYLHHGYDVLELLHSPELGTSTPLFGHFALRVDDVAMALKLAAAQGVATEPGSPRRAGSGLGNIGMISDPDGVRVEFVDRVDLRELS